jgi:hypothetical protein
LFGVVLVAAISGLAYLYLAATSQRQTLDESLCPEGGPPSQTLLLIDATDDIPALTRTQIRQLLDDMIAKIPRGGLLDIRMLRNDQNRTDRIFALCNPGDGSDLDPLIANPEAAKERWRTGFAEPLATALEQTANGEEADTSPILAAIQQLAVERLTSERDRRAATTLVLISDMLENSPDFSMYRSGADYEAFQASDAARNFATDLAGAEVDIWLVRRPAPPTDSLPLIAFWERWIKDAGGQLVHAVNLQGVD